MAIPEFKFKSKRKHAKLIEKIRKTLEYVNTVRLPVYLFDEIIENFDSIEDTRQCKEGICVDRMKNKWIRPLEK